MTVASLFAIIPDPSTGRYAAQGQDLWVYITVAVVSFLPSLDLASVVKKVIQRTIGTVIAGLLGFALGLIALEISNDVGMRVFMGVCVACVTFGASYAYSGFPSMKDYSYVSLIIVFTFGIVFFPFLTVSSDPWKASLFRMINIVIGCVISGLGGLIYPRSTRVPLKNLLDAQVYGCGESSAAVLDQAARFLQAGRGAGVQENIGSCVELCENTISGIDKIRKLLPLLVYDPFLNSTESECFVKEANALVAHSFRIQTTSVLLDAVFRENHKLVFSAETIRHIKETAKLLRVMAQDFPKKQANDVEDGGLNSVFRDITDQLVEKLLIFRSEQIRIANEINAEMSVDANATRNDCQNAIKLFEEGLVTGSEPRMEHDRCLLDTLFFLQLLQLSVERMLQLYHHFADYLVKVKAKGQDSLFLDYF